MTAISHLEKYYPLGKRKFHALKSVDLTVENGEMVANMGKSGAGKSTLLHIISGLDRFDTGSYLLDGIEMNQLNEKKIAKIRNRKIGIILQDFALIGDQTVLFNTMLPLYFSPVGMGRGEMKKRAQKVLEDLGIDDQAGKNVNQLSGGQKQRVAIARAIINEPSLVIADEPTGNLDSVTTNEIMGIFSSLNAAGKTVLIVTHDDTVASCCKRVVTIADGKITSQE